MHFLKYALSTINNWIDTMGLLSILKKVKLKERELRIIILGLDNAG